MPSVSAGPGRSFRTFASIRPASDVDGGELAGAELEDGDAELEPLEGGGGVELVELMPKDARFHHASAPATRTSSATTRPPLPLAALETRASEVLALTTRSPS
jgi:hypothetical protein